MCKNSIRFVTILFSASELVSVSSIYQLFVGYLVKSKINYSKLVRQLKKKKFREGPNLRTLLMSSRTMACFLWISDIFSPNIPVKLIPFSA